MDKLRKQSVKMTYYAIVLSSSMYYFMYFTFKWFAAFTDDLGVFNISWTILPITLIYLYDKVFWKIFNPDLDFHGYWDFEEDQFSMPKHQFDYHAYGHMKIRQDANSIRIVNGKTIKQGNVNDQDHEVATWWSIACELNENNGTITAALDHQSSPNRIGGAIKYGVEIITITERDYKERPIKMSSKVYHCIGSGQPRIVSTSYVRRSSASKMQRGRKVKT